MLLFFTRDNVVFHSRQCCCFSLETMLLFFTWDNVVVFHSRQWCCFSLKIMVVIFFTLVNFGYFFHLRQSFVVVFFHSKECWCFFVAEDNIDYFYHFRCLHWYELDHSRTTCLYSTTFYAAQLGLVPGRPILYRSHLYQPMRTPTHQCLETHI